MLNAANICCSLFSSCCQLLVQAGSASNCSSFVLPGHRLDTVHAVQWQSLTFGQGQVQPFPAEALVCCCCSVEELYRQPWVMLIWGWNSCQNGLQVFFVSLRIVQATLSIWTWMSLTHILSHRVHRDVAVCCLPPPPHPTPTPPPRSEIVLLSHWRP